MVLYSTDYEYFTIVSKVSPRVRLSTCSIYAFARVKWPLLFVVVVCIEQNGEFNLQVGLWNI